MKKCSKCKIKKEEKEFHKNSKSIDGLMCQCKKCRNKYYIKKDKKKILFKNTKICSKCNIEKKFEEYSKNKNLLGGIENICKKCIKEYKKINSKKISKYNVKYRNSNKGVEQKLNYYKENKESIKEKSKKKYYKIKNTGYYKKYKREYIKNREESNSLFKLKNRTAALIRNTMFISKKSKSTSNILKCSLLDFKKYIESQWENWMTWDNYGKYDGNYKTGWDLDHIIPVTYANTKEEIYTLNHWSNFQPLCSKINRYDKKDKIYPVYNLELNLTVS